MREVPVIVQIEPHWIFLKLLKRRRIDGIYVNSMEEESSRAFVLIKAHVFHHLTYGGEDTETGVAVGTSLSAIRITLIGIQIIIAIGRSRVPKAVAAICKVQYTTRVHLKITF